MIHLLNTPISPELSIGIHLLNTPISIGIHLYISVNNL